MEIKATVLQGIVRQTNEQIEILRDRRSSGYRRKEKGEILEISAIITESTNEKLKKLSRTLKQSITNIYLAMLKAWLKIGAPAFKSPATSEKRTVKKKLSIDAVFDTTPLEEARFSYGSFIEAALPIYIGREDEAFCKEVDNQLGLDGIVFSKKPQDAKSTTLPMRRSIFLRAGNVCAIKKIPKTRVMELLLKNWLLSGGGNIFPEYVKASKEAIIANGIRLDPAFIAQIEESCKRIGLSRRKVIEGLLVAWISDFETGSTEKQA